MTTDLHSALGKTIKKLTTLHELLRDPEVEAMLLQLLPSRNGTREAATPRIETPVTPTRLHKRRTKKGKKTPRAEIVKAIQEELKNSSKMMTANQITDALGKRGIALSAKKAKLAMSKRLRVLAEQQQIAEKKGEGTTSAILYGPIRRE